MKHATPTSENIEAISSILDKPNETPNDNESSQRNEKLDYTRLLNKEDYEALNKEMLSEFGFEWGAYEEHLTRPLMLNEVEYMIPGTLKLIAQVVQSSVENNPYDSIVFLDKSGRPGAYLYLSLLKKMRDAGIISERIVFPKIKFMDIGKTDDPWKFESERSAQVMLEKMPKDTIVPRGQESKVLIVDEFKDTGKTLTNAVKVFEDTYGITPESAYQFDPKFGPFWYRDSTAKLVRDGKINKQVQEFVSLSDEEIKKKGIDPLELEAFKYLSHILSEKDFIDIYDRRIDDILEQKETDIASLVKILESRGVEMSERLSHNLKILAGTNIKLLPEGIYEFYRTAGGRFALPNTERKNALELINMLNKLSSKVVERMESKHRQ